MSTDHLLPRRERGFIVLLALLQGLLLHIADYGQDHGWWPFDALAGRVCWYTLVLSIPTAMLLSLCDLADRRFWQHAAIVGLVFGALGAYAAWSATGHAGIEASHVLGPFGFSAAVALFIALPYLQCRLSHGRWCAPYGELFEHAWQNAITLALAGLFVGICWMLLFLWAQLFKLIQIHFFNDLFQERPFVYLATGVMVGLGLLIGRTQHRAVQIARQILLAIGKGLLPLVAFIGLLFIAALPFTGLDALWKTKQATEILLWLVALTIGFVNAVYQDGAHPAPYPRPLRLLVEAALCTLPVFAGLAIYALLLRQAQYGWTGDRFTAMLIAVMLTAYALAYAWAVIRRKVWQPALGRSNVALSLGVIGLVILANTPPLDPHRIGVASQYARLSDGTVKTADLVYLRFESGRRGYEALQTLRQQPVIANDTKLAEETDALLKRNSRYSGSDSSNPAPEATTIETLRKTLKVSRDAAPPSDAWLQTLIDNKVRAQPCVQLDGTCYAANPDIDGDGRNEMLLCNLGEPYMVLCSVWSQGEGGWSYVGQLHWYGGEVDNVKEAVREGRITVKPRRWRDVDIGGQSRTLDEQ